MTSASVPGIHGWGNRHSLWVRGAIGLSPCYGGGLQAPFFFSPGVAGLAAHIRLLGCMASVFLRPCKRDVPADHRYLRRPQLLTRSVPLPTGRDISSLRYLWKDAGANAPPAG